MTKPEVEKFTRLAQIFRRAGMGPEEMGIPETLLGTEWAVCWEESTKSWDVLPIQYNTDIEGEWFADFSREV